MINDPVVDTKYGKIRGVTHKGKYFSVCSYRGIPYAQPPVGDLRWAPPVSPKPWSGVRDCTGYGPICVQPTVGMMAEPWGTDFYYAGLPPMSEDCLYLNVTTAAESADEKRPVFLWLHGGGSDHGFSYEPEFNPEELALKGAVVVTVGHRLGVFGYMALPQITEAYGKSGNYILMDDMKALEWVIENIEAFGGDPDCITVGGQSAGCAKATTLACTSLAKGHIRRVINDSGLCWSRDSKTPEESYDEWTKYLTEIGINPKGSLEELRGISAERLLPASRKHIPGNLVVDGDIVPNVKLEDTLDLYQRELDFMSGFNLGETAICPGRDRTEKGFESAKEFYSYCRQILGDIYDRYHFETLVPVTDENVDAESRRLAAYGLHIGGRMGNLAVNRRFCAYRREHAHDKGTYTYLFSRVPPCSEEEKGTQRDASCLLSWYSGELWYNFASLRKDIPPARPWEKVDFQLADCMSSYWANFIRTGNPNGEGLPYWGQGPDGFMELCEEPHMSSWNTEIHSLIEEFLEPYRVFPR